MKTAMLMAAMTALFMLLGNYFGGQQGMFMMLIISLAMNFYTYWNSDRLVLAQYKARKVDMNSAPGLYRIVDGLAKKANIQTPRVYIVPSNVPNAFATGRNPEHAAVAVHSGLVDILNKDEIEGVIGHELSHILHRDTLISTVAASMAGAITYIAQFGFFFSGGRNNRNSIGSLLILLLAPMAAMVIQMAVSRSREYEADRSGGALCGNPDALADALLKLDQYSKRELMQNATPTTAHMFIVNPFSAKNMQKMFSTHPSTEERVKLLREQAEVMRENGELR